MASACAPPADAAITWTARFECQPELAASQHVTLGIVPGDCPRSGKPVYEVTVGRNGEQALLPPGTLPDGSYAFYGVALDKDGRKVAEDCSNVVLPEVDAVALVLRGAVACREGEFVSPRAGGAGTTDEPRPEPYLELPKATYALNEPVVVYFHDLPRGKRDWVGLYKAGAPNKDYLEFVYTEGAADGSMTFKGLGAGSYDARLFFNDTYDLEYELSFTVK